MKLLYGTTNCAKLDLMRRAVAELDLEIIGLSDIGRPLPVIEESGIEPIENAEIKARAYYKAFGMPVFSCDSGLYFDGLPDCEQPKTHIRRVNGVELTDEQMTAYYADLARRHGGRLVARYRNAIYLIYDENNVFSSMDDSLASEPFIISSVPHEKTVQGFPIDRLSVDIKTGKYYYDLHGNYADKVATVVGFAAYFKKISDVLNKVRT